MPPHERAFHFNCPSGSGPLALAQSLYLPDEGVFAIEGWISNFGASNVHIFGGNLSAAECAQRLADPVGGGITDMLVTLPSSGPGRVWLPSNVSTVTVFYESLNNSGQAQVVTVRVVDR